MHLFRSSLILTQGQLQPWTDRQLRGVYIFYELIASGRENAV